MTLHYDARIASPLTRRNQARAWENARLCPVPADLIRWEQGGIGSVEVSTLGREAEITMSVDKRLIIRGKRDIAFLITSTEYEDDGDIHGWALTPVDEADRAIVPLVFVYNYND